LLPKLPLSVSLKEAAATLGVSASTVRRLSKAGNVRTIRLGRRRMIPFESLEELIQVREAK
jgi:excisionase family DNA binding protein